jgi:hypothetical protein
VAGFSAPSVYSIPFRFNVLTKRRWGASLSRIQETSRLLAIPFLPPPNSQFDDLKSAISFVQSKRSDAIGIDRISLSGDRKTG